MFDVLECLNTSPLCTKRDTSIKLSLKDSFLLYDFKTTIFKSCATKPQLSLAGYEFSCAIKKHLDLPTKSQSSLDDYEFSAAIKKYLDLPDSFSFSRSTSSTPRNQFSSSYQYKDVLRESE